MHLRDELTLLDRRVLGLLPNEGEMLGPHVLTKSVKSIIEDLAYEVTPDEVNGRLRHMAAYSPPLVVYVQDVGGVSGNRRRRQNGWQATADGDRLSREWDTMTVSSVLGRANRDGEGMAVVNHRGKPVAYVATPRRYERMADDPSASSVVVETAGAGVAA